MLDKKKRPEVGIDDIDKYEFGGLEIDNQLTNGYQLYIPYGLHCGLFNAIEDSIRLMNNQKYECKTHIINLTNDMKKLEDKNRPMAEYAINIQKETIERIDKNLKILEKIVLLKNEI